MAHLLILAIPIVICALIFPFAGFEERAIEKLIEVAVEVSGEIFVEG